MLYSDLDFYTRAQLKSKPHPVFRKDWFSYDSDKFARTFLPYVDKYYGRNFLVFDGAELFNGISINEKQLVLNRGEAEIQSIIYTFPKDALASEMKANLSPKKNEICSFVEIDNNNNIELSITFGSYFKFFLSEYYSHTETANDLVNVENTVFKKSSNEFKLLFNTGNSQANHLLFVFNLLKIEKDKVLEFIAYKNIFSKKFKNYIRDFRIEKKYRIAIFIEKSIGDVFDKIEGIPSKGIKKVSPEPDEIYIWLVSEDYINYLQFVRISMGINVAKHYLAKGVTEEYLQEIIAEQINEEVGQIVLEEGYLRAVIDKSLVTSQITYALNSYFEENPVAKELFESNPTAFMIIKAAEYTAQSIKKLRFKDNRWNPNVQPFDPVLKGNTLNNAFFCGIYNGLIDMIASIPEMIAFFTKLLHDKKFANELIDSIYKIIEEERIIETIIDAITKDYKNAKSVEEIYYYIGVDTLSLVSTMIGLYGTVVSVGNFINFTKKAVSYLRVHGRKGIKRLKNLPIGKKREIFENIEYEEKLRKVEDLIDTLGGRLLNKKELKLLKHELKVKYGVQLRLIDKEVGFQKLPTKKNGKKVYVRSKDLLKDWEKRGVVGKFDEGPPPIMILRSNNASQLTVFHERVHMEFWHKNLPKMHIVDEEKLVFEAIVKAKDTHHWTADELIDAYDYVNNIIYRWNKQGKNFSYVKNEYIEQLKWNKKLNLN